MSEIVGRIDARARARTCDRCKFHEANPRGWQWDYCDRPGPERARKMPLCAEMRQGPCGAEAKLFEPRTATKK
jgi:hypothetical protein